MNRRKLSTVFLILVLTSSSGVFAKQEEAPVPLPVAMKYNEFEKMYEKGLGATLEQCTNGKERIYKLTGSSGFEGQIAYYEEIGREIGIERFSDMGTDKPVLNIFEYKCFPVKKSKAEKAE